MSRSWQAKSVMQDAEVGQNIYSSDLPGLLKSKNKFPKFPSAPEIREKGLRDRSLFIERGGLVQIRGGSPFFMQKFKGGPQENMQMYKPIKC